MSLMPVMPLWAVAAVVAGLLALLAYGSWVLLRKRVPPRWIGYLSVLRVLAVALFALCLLRPTVTRTASVERKPDLLVLLDTSRSMAAESPGRPSRLQQALDRMRDVGLDAKIEAGFDVYWFAFDADARPVAARERGRLECGGDSTRLARSLATAWAVYRQTARDVPGAGGAPARALIVTDGNDRAPEDPVETARRLGLAVSALPAPETPETAAPPRVEIASLQGTWRVLLGSECRFRAAIRHEGAAGVPLRVELADEDQTVAATDLQFGPAESERQLTLVHRPTSLGVKRYRLRVTALDTQRKLPTGQPAEISVNVVGRSNRVLYFEDDWRWDLKYLRRVAEDDPGFSMTTFLARGRGIYMQLAEPDRAVTLGGFPQSRSELDWFDLIILGAVAPAGWPSGLSAAIHALVVDGGKSLVFLAGPNLGRVAQDPFLASLLPVELTPESARPVAGPVDVRPGAAAVAAAYFYTPAAAGIRWAELPPMDQIYAPLRKRPAATVLLEAKNHANPFGNLIVMAEHTVGRGHVLYVGTDSLWKWQMLPAADELGNTPHRVFWQQALRALAPLRPAEGSVSLWLEPERSRYVAGQTARLTAECEGVRDADGTTVEAHAILPDGRKLPLSLLPEPARPHVYRAEFVVPQPGAYRIEGVALSDDKPVATTVVNLDVVSPPDEGARTANRADLLQRLTAETGGRVVEVANPATWPAPASARPPRVEEMRRIDLWGRFVLLGALVFVLALDWLLRLLRGFV